MSEIAGAGPVGATRIGVGTAIVLALAAGAVTWVLLARNGDSEPAATAAAATSDQPRIATVDGLSALAGLRGAPVYWAGPRAGFVYEVTETSARHVFVRYLPSGTRVGDPRPAYLTVATYPLADGFAAVQEAAERPGAVTFRVRGGIAVYDAGTPTSVYLAFSGSPEQIEVYSPSAEQARRLVESGRIAPVP
jgi:hypothetical protein